MIKKIIISVIDANDRMRYIYLCREDEDTYVAYDKDRKLMFSADADKLIDDVYREFDCMEIRTRDEK